MVMVLMVPLIISHDGAVHWNTIRSWKNFASDIQVDWVRMSQSVIRFNVVIVGKFFKKGSWVSEAWRRSTQKRQPMNQNVVPREMPRLRSEGNN